jgi:hypothetical protein
VRSTETGLSLESALTGAVALALGGDWSGAERVVDACLREVPVEGLPHAYIAAVDLVARLLTAAPAAAGPGPIAPVVRISSAVAPSPGPRLLASSDPALNYAHAVLTALRGRLTGVQPAPVRRAS